MHHLLVSRQNNVREVKENIAFYWVEEAPDNAWVIMMRYGQHGKQRCNKIESLHKARALDSRIAGASNLADV